MAASAARTSRTSSPKDNTDESLAAGGLTPGLDGLERFAAVAFPGVAGDAGGDAPDAGRARLFGGIEARRGRDPKPAGDFDTPGTAPEECAGRTTSAVVRRLARLEKDTARPRCMRRPLARGVRLGESGHDPTESDASSKRRHSRNFENLTNTVKFHLSSRFLALRVAFARGRSSGRRRTGRVVGSQTHGSLGAWLLNA